MYTPQRTKSSYSSFLRAVAAVAASTALLQATEDTLLDESTFQTAGSLSTEHWLNIDAFDVSDLVINDKFFGRPDTVGSVSSGSYFSIPRYSGARVRGYLTAPETGYYTFWLSASTSGELWLSSDETKYRKQLLSKFGGDSGTGSRGVAYKDGNLWDTYSAQMSEEVYLEAGQTYFLEMLTQQHHVADRDRHLSVAWVRPGQDRELIPATYFKSYIQENDDLDDDYLPDAWEAQHGLSTNDNGLTDRNREGERGDYDADGLSNREEYVLGTDPTNADTDGDGLSDGDEVNSFGTDPALTDAPSETLLSSLDLSSYSSDGLTWTSTSQGLIPSSFRGDISWNFTVPTSGYWSINAATKLAGDLYLQENVDFIISIDGNVVSKKSLAYSQDSEAILRILTPLLSAGTHNLRIEIDNLAARRVVTFQSIQILEPQGADLDNDGHPDWITSQLTGANTLAPYQPLSRTSPAFLEGDARIVNQVLVNGANVQRGIDSNHWYAGLKLQDQGATSFTVDLENNVNESGSIQWQPTNVLDSETLIVRANDSLKLSTSSVESGTVHIPNINLARLSGANATQSSTAWGNPEASRAIDGNTSGLWADNSVMKTDNKADSWWQVDLGSEHSISQVSIWNRTTGTLNQYLSNYRISVLDNNGNTVTSQDFYVTSGYGQTNEIWTLPNPVVGRTVKIQKLGKGRQNQYALSFAEVEILGGGSVTDLNSPTEYVIYQLVKPGVNTITATAADGTTGTLTVHVKQASFSPVAMDLVSNTVGALNFSPSLVSPDLYFEGGNAVDINQNYTVSSSNIALQASPKLRGQYNLIARLHENGPILATQPLNLIGIADVIQTGLTSTFFSRDFNGYIQINSPIVATGLPAGGSVVVTIHRSGVTFLDGTKTRKLRAEDFINGVYHLDFLFPIGLTGGYCHYLDIYDRNGVFVARR